MTPEVFAARYPHLAAVLMAMKTATSANFPPDEGSRAGLGKELVDLNQSTESLHNVLEGLFGQPFRPNEDFVHFSLRAYDFLGVSNDVCVFMGRLWAEAISACDVSQRGAFLMKLIEERETLFGALDFAVELFGRVKFTANEVFPWIEKAHHSVGKDLFQRGFWGCLEAYCTKSTEEAITFVGRWLDTNPQGPSLGVATNMIAWLRLAVVSDHSLSPRFAAIEERVRGGGHSAWRALYIQSRAYGVPHLVIGEQEALQLRDEYVRHGSEEEVAWCFLLNSVLHVKPHEEWARREARRISRPQLPEPAKYWVAVATLDGLASCSDHVSDHADEYLAIFSQLLPIGAESTGIWEHVYGTLKSLLDTRTEMARTLMKTLAAHSGETWLKIARDRQFASLFHLLRQKNLHRFVAEDLCFHQNVTARHLGLVIFSDCNVEGISTEALNAATDTQIELLFLEALRRLMDFGALARLQSCIATRIDSIGGDLATLFHEECALQCLNTYKYRSELATCARNHEYLPDIVADATERLANTAAASKSPALQMEVPGMARAQRMHDSKFVREVAKSVKEHSVFLSSFPTVTILYGGNEFRTFVGDRLMEGPSKMHRSSAEVEVPRLEFVDPETMHLRRVAASNRIAQLQGRDITESGRES